MAADRNAQHPKELDGLELYELRPEASTVKKKWSALAGSSKASLHTKAYVVDRKLVAIGSFNVAPRSIALNTKTASG